MPEERKCPYSYCTNISLTLKYIIDYCKGNYESCEEYKKRKEGGLIKIVEK